MTTGLQFILVHIVVEKGEKMPRKGLTEDKQNIFYREPGNEYQASCSSSTNHWAYCVLEKDCTLTFIDGDYRQGGVTLSIAHHAHRNKYYWLAVEEYLERLATDQQDYYKKISMMLQANNVYDYIVDKIKEAKELTCYNETASLSLANRMLKILIKDQLKGRTYSDAIPNQYIKDYNMIFEKIKSLASKKV